LGHFPHEITFFRSNIWKKFANKEKHCSQVRLGDSCMAQGNREELCARSVAQNVGLLITTSRDAWELWDHNKEHLADHMG
jgi:hypothetical protein